MCFYQSLLGLKPLQIHHVVSFDIMSDDDKCVLIFTINFYHVVYKK